MENSEAGVTDAKDLSWSMGVAIYLPHVNELLLGAALRWRLFSKTADRGGLLADHLCRYWGSKSFNSTGTIWVAQWSVTALQAPVSMRQVAPHMADEFSQFKLHTHHRGVF